ncbi:MAG: nucleotidyltransferase domain-containing protein [Candidatus Sulfotelmatobacter sp.]
MASAATDRGTAGFLNSGLQRASREAAIKREELDILLSEEIGRYTSHDTSLVVFGSLARGEWTSGSDLDWTYLIDGEANSDHLTIVQQIQNVLQQKRNKQKFRPPSPAGAFGNMAFSHDIIHQIGGHNDTNKNTTWRILLLLESQAIGKNTDAYERVIKAVIGRYLAEDSHPLTHDSRRYRVPRFLLNDIVRFWRTMAVDFASKQRDRAGKGWGLRNAKLRMSRKLIFASGLLVCFSAHLDLLPQGNISTDGNDIKLHLLQHIRDHVKLTPLEILEKSIGLYGIPAAIAKELFASYAEFLKVLDDKDARSKLDKLRSEDSRRDPTFKRIRKISQSFEHALDYIFFSGNSPIAPLTRKYGVF